MLTSNDLYRLEVGDSSRIFRKALHDMKDWLGIPNTEVYNATLARERGSVFRWKT